MTTTSLFEIAAPVSAGAHLVDTGRGTLLLVPDGSRVYDVDAETAAAVDRARRAVSAGMDFAEPPKVPCWA